MQSSKLINFGITLPYATDLGVFFSSCAYIGDFVDTDLKDDVTVPSSGYFTFGSTEEVASKFLSTTQYYKDLVAIFTQNGNTRPNQGRVQRVICFQKTEGHSTWGDAFTELHTANGNWAQICISSRDATAIASVASAVESVTGGRLFEAQTSDADVTTNGSGNIALTLKTAGYANTKLTYTGVSTDSISPAIMAIQASEKLGANGDLYSKLSGQSAREYESSIESALDDNNVSYYTTVNPVSGGSVSAYATNIYYGGKMANGEDAKRRRIRFYIEYMMKAVSLDFLAKKLTYQDRSGAVLESMLTALLIECQSNDLIVQDTEDTNGFYLNVLSMAETKKNYVSLYNTQTYKVVGWYIDALTGRKVDISLSVDPSDAEKALIQ